MDFGATETFGFHRLSCGHFDQGRTAEEHLSLVLDHDCVVRECWLICAAGGGRAEYNGTGRDVEGAADGKITEDLTTLVEDSKLVR